MVSSPAYPQSLQWQIVWFLKILKYTLFRRWASWFQVESLYWNTSLQVKFSLRKRQFLWLFFFITAKFCWHLHFLTRLPVHFLQRGVRGGAPGGIWDCKCTYLPCTAILLKIGLRDFSIRRWRERYFITIQIWHERSYIYIPVQYFWQQSQINAGITDKCISVI